MNVNFETFNQRFFKNYSGEIIWFNKKGVKRLSDDKNAEITIVTRGIQGHYTGYMVDIKHKNSGTIASHFFGFDDYIRTDTKKYLIIEHATENNANWHVNKPSEKEVEQMAGKIIQYIDLYN